MKWTLKTEYDLLYERLLYIIHAIGTQVMIPDGGFKKKSMNRLTSSCVSVTYKFCICVQEKKPGFFLQSGSRPVWEKAGFLAHFRIFVL